MSEAKVYASRHRWRFNSVDSKIIVRWIVWATCVVEELCVAVVEGATEALEDVEEEEGDKVIEEEEEAPGVGAIEIDVRGLTVRDKDGDEVIEEEEEALGVGAIEIDVLDLTVGDKDGDEEIEEEGEGEEEEEEEEEEAPGVGAIEIDVLGLTVGAVKMIRGGVEATGADG